MCKATEQLIRLSLYNAIALAPQAVDVWLLTLEYIAAIAQADDLIDIPNCRSPAQQQVFVDVVPRGHMLE